MGHGIEQNDKGVVFGTTWHKLPQYLQLEARPTFEQVKAALNYEVIKVPVNDVIDGKSVPGNFCLKRADDRSNLDVRCVGSRYMPLQNIEMLDYINESIMAPNPDMIAFDSAGSFNGGQTAFIGMEVLRVQISGDASDIATKILFSNPFGRSCAEVLKTNVRTLCANTHRMARMQGIENGSISRFRHHAQVKEKVQGAIINLAEEISGMKLYIGNLEQMAATEMSDGEATNFVAALLPFTATETENKREFEKIQLNRDIVLDVFKRNNFETMTVRTGRSRYGMFNAVTYWVGHPDYMRTPRKNMNRFKLAWDGMIEGTEQDEIKQKAWNLLAV